ncbi:lipoate-protein ligase A [Streptomyces collinus]
MIERMISSFAGRYGLTQGKVTDEELTRATGLAREKFASADWTA